MTTPLTAIGRVMTMRMVDHTGERFGLLVARARDASRRGVHWICECDCGASIAVAGGNLRSGHTRSCGCLRSEVVSKWATARNTVHGHNCVGAQTPTHRSWESMLKRCRNPKNKNYPAYGGRGITVCERWLEFAKFLEDMGERPSGLTLDRIDVNGNYEKLNCRWATRSEQQKNKRCHVR